VVLLVLAIVWGVLLISWLRSRSVGAMSDSVGTFRRHLRVLERAAPVSVAPANRLRGHHIPAYRSSSMPSRPPRTAPDPPGYPGVYARPAGARTDMAAFHRRQSQRRRRDVFLALAAGAAGSFLLAVAGVSALWPVQAFFDILLVAYVALLVRMRNLALERQVKVSYASPRRRPAGRRQAYPSYAGSRGYDIYGHEGDGYDFGVAGYDLDLRRAAN